MAAANRIKKELEEIQNDPPANCSAGLDGDDIYNWTATIMGPTATPYHGGVFYLNITFPQNYPFKPPKVHFVTKIYHPNVTASSGEVCPELLTENWKPHLNIRYIMECLRTLLICPNPTNPLDEQIGLHYIENRDEFNALAEKWTKMHATQI